MIDIDVSKCDECGTCVSVCGRGALALGKRLTVSPGKCASCGACVNVCPFGALALQNQLI